MKRLLACILVLLMAGFVSANAHGNLDVGAGMVSPDSPVYGLEVAWDNAAVSVGLKQAGKVAQERAAEAEKMAANGDHESAARAANEMSKVAQKAKSRDTEGLAKAASVLEEVMANAPAEAQQGLQTALDSVKMAQERAAAAGAAPDQGQAPDGQMGSDAAPDDTPDGSGMADNAGQ